MKMEMATAIPTAAATTASPRKDERPRVNSTPREPEGEDATGERDSEGEPTNEVHYMDTEIDMRCDEAADADDDSEDDADARELDDAPVREYPEEYARYMLPMRDAATAAATQLTSPVGQNNNGKRKRSSDGGDAGDASAPRVVIGGIDYGRPLTTTAKRKGSSDFLRKGQWTPTEERLAKLLIEAFEEGYLPVYTGIRLRGYLAVQLQCDPMRVSKKLCAGTIDGKRIPKNYGQKKFRLRKKALWDREEAGRILATLERLTKELWAETGIPPPPFLTLSSTRNAEEDIQIDGSAAKHSPVKRLSPPANKSKKQKTGVVFPIIYLNLSKKMKQGQQGSSSNGQSVYANSMEYFGPDGLYGRHPDGRAHLIGYTSSHPNDSDESGSSDESRAIVQVDGESLQAAYELLNLSSHCASPSNSRSSTPGTPTETVESPSQSVKPVETQQSNASSSRPAQVSGVAPIRPAPAKPSILRQHAPTVAS